MAFNSSAFFLGIGQVVLTVAIGFGGGVYLTQAFTADAKPEPGKLEQKAFEKPATVVVASPAEAKDAEISATPVVQSPSDPSNVQKATTLQDTFAMAGEVDVQREARRKEHVRRAELRKASELTRRKLQERRVIAERKRYDEPRRQVQASEGDRIARSPSFDPLGLSN
jgi:hypothetical protein